MPTRNASRTSAILLAGLLTFFPAYGQNPAITINIDANSDRHPISPLIYGVAFASPAQLSDLNFTINRQGGNNQTRYNWQINADNKDADWYFESIGDTSSTAGERADTFVSGNKSAGAQSMLTIPMIDWIAKLGANRAKLDSFSVAKYGAQTGVDPYWSDAGDGVSGATGQNITGNDPNDANVANSSTYELGWLQHLTGAWGTAANGGVQYYLLDNEPSIWFSTHRDVEPAGQTMQQMLNRMLDFGGKIKANDPTALVAGPEEWGWSAYFYSGYDQQYGSLHGWSYLPDRTNNGGWDYLPWMLNQLHQNNTSSGQRLLDVFSVHYYPQSGEFSTDNSTATQLLRNQSTRSLWDPNYVDQSWIGSVVQLIPRLRSWVSTYYPGTKTAITEYNWGDEAFINGATTQADILGIFGRESLDIGTRWTTPDPSTPTYLAMKMYRNYDNAKSTFGDTSVSDVAPNADNVSSFAALRSSDGALTVIAIAKALSGSTPATFSIANFSAQGTAQVYQLTAANSINRLTDIGLSGSSFTYSLPAQSITLFVIPPGTGNQPPTAVISASPTSGTAPLAVSFNGAGSSDSDGSITSYAWTFGDGRSASGVTANHTYSAAGSYTATLTVTDNGGATGSANVPITATALTLNAPTNLTASASSKTVTLKWKDNSSNEAGFYIERAPSAKKPSFSRVGQVGANVTMFSQTVASGSYIYRVQAYLGSVVSAYSNQASVRVR